MVKTTRGRFVGFFLLVVLCLLWTLALLALTINPNAVVNRVMATTALDGGLFWLFVDAPLSALALGVVGLSCVAIGFAVVLMQLISSQRQSNRVQALSPRDTHLHAIQTATRERLTKLFADAEREGRRRATIPLKIADLAVQTAMLVQQMEDGLPASLLAVYCSLVAGNALCFAIVVAVRHTHMGLTHAFLNFLFDFGVAVVYPIIVLVYSFTSFTFDRELMDINSNVFPVGSFEHAASVIANPVEIAIIRDSIDSLRVNSVAKAFTRVGTAIGLWHHAHQYSKLLCLQRRGHQQPSLYPSRNRRLGAVFVAFAVALIVVSERSISTSSAACVAHPQCAQIARRWVAGLREGDTTRCPCVAIIDRNVTVAKFEEWWFPPDRTEQLKHLATPGYLRTIQFVNRGLTHLPEELRLCSGLRHLSLYYSGNLTLPPWFGDFTKLEYLHIEGLDVLRTLQPLSPRLFDKMRSLSFIHLASHVIPELPSFDNLVSLKSLSLAALRMVEKLPSFDALQSLERLVLHSMHYVPTLPDLANVRDLRVFITSDRGAFCCNGFLGPHRCNLTHSLCRQHLMSGAPAITQCLSPTLQASAATVSVFDNHIATACHDEAMRPGELKLLSLPLEMLQCNGTMYRQCQVPGSNRTGMCYNARWMAVACDPTPFAIEMRRQQIARGRGAPCNPHVEAWLGCK